MTEAKPFAYCCAEAGGNPERCDCANKDHGIALFEATCSMTNCRNRAPADEAFCSSHRKAVSHDGAIGRRYLPTPPEAS